MYRNVYIPFIESTAAPMYMRLYFHVTQLYSHQIRTANQIRRFYKNDPSDIFVTVYCVTWKYNRTCSEISQWVKYMHRYVPHFCFSSYAIKIAFMRVFPKTIVPATKPCKLSLHWSEAWWSELGGGTITPGKNLMFEWSKDSSNDYKCCKQF